MSDYVAPLKDIEFVLNELAELGRLSQLPAFEASTPDVVAAVLEEAGKFASGVLAPLNTVGDQQGAVCENKSVRETPGFADAYRQYVEGGWVSLPGNPQYGGMGLPECVAMATMEMAVAANISFSLCPMLGQGAIGAIEAHASDWLKQTFLAKLISGEWTGTMNLTEPQAGSDLAVVRTRAVPAGDHYRLTGTKIFITWGDHQMTDNIVHLVLARTPDAPEGVKGISLFVVPKFLVNADGSPGERNDAYAVSVEHKLGIHGSPTCVMSYGDNGGAVGYLVGEENQGLAYMFTMMNHARLNVGVQGVGLADRAYQHAVAYARERVQGKTPGDSEQQPIIRHPDVRRMLMQMRALTEASRALCYVASACFDYAHHGDDQQHREASRARGELLTPLAKGWSTEIAQEVTSLGIQVHGGMGYVEETGAAQYYRDARITAIYEGTTAIQANDLVGRKFIRDGGAQLRALLADMYSTLAQLNCGGSELQSIAGAFKPVLKRLQQLSEFILQHHQQDVRLPGAVSFNLLMALGTATGGWLLAHSALIAASKTDGDSAFYGAKIATALFFAQHLLPRASAFAEAALSGSEAIMGLSDEQF